MKTELTVSAAISLSGALQELSTSFHELNPDVEVRYNFGGSGALEQQIEEGAPVDVFISASAFSMELAIKKGLSATGRPHVVARNSLLLVTPAGDFYVQSVQDLAGERVKRIAIGEPGSVPAGQYAMESLRFAGIEDQVKAKLLFAKDVRQVLTYVENGEVDVGFVYATDARASDRVRVVTTMPAESHHPIEYPACVLKNSRHEEAAEAFLKYLRSSNGAKIFRSYGFLPVE